ncbi:nitrogen regulatory protein P-II family [Desulfatibacillum alkenivorans DSM 16219]|jgi:hypothetical protein|uniref:Nitrogen regulatory protein P-II family n=1 Tax=Desulfatibacillum alkenivorans DSM 16219 TaxID=1121393 RepID=A0A1M6NPZ4_9BACT|nr:hypothetical protein [Desulfatibacillum alkenivorans]SHJ97783.1 nitrogen regulatory protein P-II family [Desulfatibacillum alkenivorans DSM 16219]
MYLLIAVINNEQVLEDLVTGWIDMGITEATVAETTDLLQLISNNIPIFAGFRTMTTGGATHNKTIFTAVEDKELLDKATGFIQSLFRQTGKPSQGFYFVVPLVDKGALGLEAL